MIRAEKAGFVGLSLLLLFHRENYSFTSSTDACEDDLTRSMP